MSVQLGFTPSAVFKDGVYAGGAKASFFLSGTTTPIAVYTTEALTSAHPVPLVADSYGIFPQAFTDGAQQLKVVITTSVDTAIVTIDPVFLVAAPPYQVSDVDTFADLAALRGITVGHYVRVVSIGATYQVVASGGDLDYSESGGLRFDVVVGDARAYGAAGDGVTDDTDVFTLIDTAQADQVVDLAGLTYQVDAIPLGAAYQNGFFVVSGATYNAPASKFALIGETAGDTGEVGTPYAGGVENAFSFAGRSTEYTVGNMFSSDCLAEFVRSGNVFSIYSWARGNVSGNFAARQCVAGTPQSVNLGSEECWVWGGFRGANLCSGFSTSSNESGSNISARYCSAAGRYSSNIASTACFASRGGGSILDVERASGVVTAVTVSEAGEKYEVGDPLTFYGRQGGSGATAEVASIDGSGGITAVTVLTGGTGYNGPTHAVVDNATGDYSANMASDSCETHGTHSANISGRDTIASGPFSFSIGSDDSLSSGTSSSVISSLSSTASGERAVVIASAAGVASGSQSVVLAGNNSQVTAADAVVMGRRTINETARSFALGDNTSGSASTANRKVHLLPNGDINAAGTITGSVTFADYAEMFENLTDGVIPLGTIVALDGHKVRPAVDGDDILGVVSATALVVAGDSPFSWGGRYLAGEFGEPLYEMVGGEKHRVESPEYKEGADNVPRSQRPAEWSCVGVLGQIHVRVTGSVSLGDYVSAAGLASAEPTGLRCMKITQEYDKSKAYAVALCMKS